MSRGPRAAERAFRKRGRRGDEEPEEASPNRPPRRRSRCARQSPCPSPSPSPSPGPSPKPLPNPSRPPTPQPQPPHVGSRGSQHRVVRAKRVPRGAPLRPHSPSRVTAPEVGVGERAIARQSYLSETRKPDLSYAARPAGDSTRKGGTGSHPRPGDRPAHRLGESMNARSCLSLRNPRRRPQRPPSPANRRASSEPPTPTSAGHPADEPASSEPVPGSGGLGRRAAIDARGRSDRRPRLDPPRRRRS